MDSKLSQICKELPLAGLTKFTVKLFDSLLTIEIDISFTADDETKTDINDLQFLFQ